MVKYSGSEKSNSFKSIRFLSVFILLIAANQVFAAPLINSVQNFKVHQPHYKFDFEVYKESGTPDMWFKTYDDFFVTRRPDMNWVYGQISGGKLVRSDILVGSVDPENVKGINIARKLPEVKFGTLPAEPKRNVFDFITPEPEFEQERQWDEIPWEIPPDDKMAFAERIYTTLKNAMSSRRNAYMQYGEPLNIRNAWQPTNLFKEVPFPGDWGQSITWANDKRGILWWSKWHIFGINTYGSKVLGAWMMDSGYGYNGSKIPMSHFWKWYDARIKLFNHFFQKEPVHDDEMAIWILNEQYLFILVPHIGGGGEDMAKLSGFFNPLEWIFQPLRLFDWVRWALGWRPTDKQMLYYLIRLSEVPDEVTLNQTIRALNTPMRPEDIHEARDVENAEAAERAQMRRKAQQGRVDTNE